ncbi:hypothetical protein [Bauldia sp.]|uniref:hypothetical protein n=1 Tax=Bauldia sp. TaxID=2575872 RepID=UPI003BAB6043
MDQAAFHKSLEGDQPPDVDGPLLALWHAKKGDWDRAHKIVQADEGELAAWVHAYLHRVEGDLPNATYWYRRAGKPVSDASHEEEWNLIVTGLANRG